MITEIPTASEFQIAGLNQLYLAWQIAMKVVQDYEEIDELIENVEQKKASAEYWAKAQPALANAFGLIQQAMEMALKGRIASFSPFLLISRDPKDWPKGVDTAPVPFSEFRTLDAADLVKVHNTFAVRPLDADFQTFWEGVRRDRNKIIHSLAVKSFDPRTVVKTLLTAARALFGDISWPQHLLNMEADGKYAAYGLDDYSYNVIMQQIEIAIRYLTPADNKFFFGYDGKRRSYICPNCYYEANRNYQETWPALAQFPLKRQGQDILHCIVCNVNSNVERIKCIDNCPGDVIHDDICLVCLSAQDNPQNFHSEFIGNRSGYEHLYRLVCSPHQGSSYNLLNFLNDEKAKEHTRLMMLNKHFSGLSSVTIYYKPNALRTLEEIAANSRLVGTWFRINGQLVWREVE
ncbi:MAG: hypothetical protein EB059_02120 [Alphaproteobacteria bacterium]|nr:hypothetical protein [Alphaproteobacteria bacterium]